MSAPGWLLVLAAGVLSWVSIAALAGRLTYALLGVGLVAVIVFWSWVAGELEWPTAPGEPRQ